MNKVAPACIVDNITISADPFFIRYSLQFTLSLCETDGILLCVELDLQCLLVIRAGEKS